MWNPNNSIFAGVASATLQMWLTSAQQAYVDLMMGGKPVTVSYDGKSVTYTAADKASLEAFITVLQRQLGIGGPRRAIVPYFR
jgi:hypothetical protein